MIDFKLLNSKEYEAYSEYKDYYTSLKTDVKNVINDYLRSITCSIVSGNPELSGGYDFKKTEIGKTIGKVLIEKFSNLIDNKGVKRFITGGALGGETLAFEVLSYLKKNKYPFINLILVLPSPNIDDKWNKSSKDILQKHMKEASYVYYANQIKNDDLESDGFFLNNTGTDIFESFIQKYDIMLMSSDNIIEITKTGNSAYTKAFNHIYQEKDILKVLNINGEISVEDMINYNKKPYKEYNFLDMYEKQVFPISLKKDIDNILHNESLLFVKDENKTILPFPNSQPYIYKDGEIITYMEKNKRYTSHFVDNNLNSVVLPQIPIVLFALEACEKIENIDLSYLNYKEIREKKIKESVLDIINLTETEFNIKKENNLEK